MVSAAGALLAVCGVTQAARVAERAQEARRRGANSAEGDSPSQDGNEGEESFRPPKLVSSKSNTTKLDFRTGTSVRNLPGNTWTTHQN